MVLPALVASDNGRPIRGCSQGTKANKTGQRYKVSRKTKSFLLRGKAVLCYQREDETKKPEFNTTHTHTCFLNEFNLKVTEVISCAVKYTLKVIFSCDSYQLLDWRKHNFNYCLHL